MKKTRKKRITPYSKIKIVGPRLKLRPYKFSDLKTLGASHEQRISKVNRFDEPVSAAKETDPKKFKERVLRYRRIAKEGHQFIFGVFDKKSGVYVGQVDFFVINKQLRWGNLGYHIQNQYFGKGYATEAAKLGLAAAFTKMDFHRIEAATEPTNKASQKVARRAGLLPEGKRKKFFPDDGGVDMIVFATNAIDHR